MKTKSTYSLVGALAGIIFACIEYFVTSGEGEPQEFVPLVLRAVLASQLIIASIFLFDSYEKRMSQKTFLFLVFLKTIFYTLSATFSLLVVNGLWFVINGDIPIAEEISLYINDEIFLINLLYIFMVVTAVVVASQVNSLHRRGELWSFILGRYHQPREVDRIFCFVDLKASTTIAEKLGHYDFARFLKDYYSDITKALRKTDAQIYQYVGDEVVLSWTFKRGLKNNNAVSCYFEMKQAINEQKQKYLNKYGVCPEFKAGMHGGSVIVTWVGELKKEIVYIGDVLNTTARIQEDCKRLGKDFLISGELLDQFSNLEDVYASFIEETIPRGKEKSIKLYSLEKKE
ncbi:MAG: adenylate/guanylate cyclase domain-containing protein [Cyclobacteriaceae bacterium]